jgi:hypothetical protein
MRSRHSQSSSVGIAVLLAACAVTPGRAQTPAATYDEVARVIREWRGRSDSAAAVRDLVLQRDAGRFTLEQGTLYLLPAVAGRVVGAVFVGTGTFAFQAPTAIEADQLERYLKHRELDEPFTALVLVFGDTTMQELERQAAFGAQPWDTKAESALRDALAYLKVPDTEAYDADVFRTLLNGGNNGLFYAHVVRRGEPIMFVLNPYEAEGVQLLRRAEVRGRRESEVIAQFPAAGADGTRERRGPENDWVRRRCAITSSTPGSRGVTWEASRSSPGHGWRWRPRGFKARGCRSASIGNSSSTRRVGRMAVRRWRSSSSGIRRCGFDCQGRRATRIRSSCSITAS